MLKRIAVALVLLLLCAVSILGVARPPRAVPATAPDTAFSAERAMRHVENILARLPSGEANGKAVLIMAHYDGAGSAALLETLRGKF